MHMYVFLFFPFLIFYSEKIFNLEMYLINSMINKNVFVFIFFFYEIEYNNNKLLNNSM
jgi:hypothetical protein